MSFIDRCDLLERFAGKSVVIVGSGPGVLKNPPGLVDSHDVVVRVNNYRCTGDATGRRTDVFYSFFGSSIHKTPEELRADGVTLCLAKCPDAKFMESEWHRRNNKPHGVDFRYIYRQRRDWWFCDTYIPPLDEFLASFELLDRHIPSTGFSALLLAMGLEPASIYLTGFDFFSSRIHNVSEPWRPGNPEDPIGHAPELERRWLAGHRDLVAMDSTLTEIMSKETA